MTQISSNWPIYPISTVPNRLQLSLPNLTTSLPLNYFLKPIYPIKLTALLLKNIFIHSKSVRENNFTYNWIHHSPSIQFISTHSQTKIRLINSTGSTRQNHHLQFNYYKNLTYNLLMHSRNLHNRDKTPASLTSNWQSSSRRPQTRPFYFQNGRPPMDHLLMTETNFRTKLRLELGRENTMGYMQQDQLNVHNPTVARGRENNVPVRKLKNWSDGSKAFYSVIARTLPKLRFTGSDWGKDEKGQKEKQRRGSWLWSFRDENGSAC